MTDDATGSIKLSTLHGLFYALSNDLITNHLCAFGAHTRNELAMVLDHVKEGDVLVDIGAHIGTFAIPCARKLGPKGKLLAIEGCPHNYARLEKNIAANGLTDRVRTVCTVVGDGFQRVHRVDVDGNTGAGFYVLDSGSEQATIDACGLMHTHGFGRPDFVKIDIEGMELLVLRSIAPIIAECRPTLYIEVCTSQLSRYGQSVAHLDDFLRSFGYRFYRNTGQRNSTNDEYIKTELSSLTDGFFDVLALQG
jgi:FkbM family methyltransferase